MGIERMEEKHKRNWQIKYKDKTKVLRQRIESCEIFHKIVASVLSENVSPSMVYYAKKQVLLQHILQRKLEALKSHIHSVLKQDMWRYDEKEINKLDLSDIPKQAYQQLVHPSPKEQFHFPKELTDLLSTFKSASAVHVDGASHFVQITFTLKEPHQHER